MSAPDMDRRSFLSLSALGLTAVGCAGTLPRTSASSPSGSVVTGSTSVRTVPLNPEVAGQKFRPRTRLGIGGVAIGNGFAPTTDAQSEATLQAAWDEGVRFFDTAPFYGFGLSERRFGRFLHNQNPDAYVLSTKVGRIFTAVPQPAVGWPWTQPAPFTYRYDYSADGVKRSIEDSLQRLGVSRIDIVLVHDLSPDTPDMGERWTEYFEQARTGAFPALARLREEGVIKAWGLGVNRPDPILRTLEVADPDIMLVATQYSLLEHREALDGVLPALERRHVSAIIGAPLKGGYLAGREHYLYGGTVPPGMAERRAQLRAVATEHGVDLRTAALQFAAAPSVVSAIIPGARSPEQTRQNAESLRVRLPAAFWDALKRQGLIAQHAPVPRAA